MSLNKYSDNLKVHVAESVNFNATPEVGSEPVDFTKSDNAMFFIEVSQWQAGDTIRIRIQQAKADDSGEKNLLTVNTIAPNAGALPDRFAVDIKAEDLDVNNGYTKAWMLVDRDSGDGETDWVTIGVVANDDHLHEDKMAWYSEVFDRMHLTPE